LCCLAVAFTSCKPDPEEPAEAANKKFIGAYDGTLVLNGTANATLPMEPYNMEIPLDSLCFVLSAEIEAGDTDESVTVTFVIDNEGYESHGTITNTQIIFEPISYHYTEEGNDFTVNLNLEGNLEGTTVKLSGPYDGTGTINMPDFPIAVPLTVTGTIDGELVKTETL
ncbi:MAG: hypothetical protein K6A28_04615, partial [Bacteroidales bacterium]|nr:hypothetical protein [Bacteroidales bacterium]